jgi:hypothetical protein
MIKKSTHPTIFSSHSEAVRALHKAKRQIAEMKSALQQVISSLETLGRDGWSEAPYPLQECRKALPTQRAHLVNAASGRVNPANF